MSNSARCGTCREDRDRCDGFVFDIALADGTTLQGVRLMGAGGVHGSGFASQANRGDTVDLERCAATLLRQVSGEAEARGCLRVRLPEGRGRGVGRGVEVCISAVPLACRPVIWPRALCRCCGRPSLTDRLLAEKLGRLGYTATPDESGRLLLADAERGEPVAIVSEIEAEALADSLLGPPVDSHVSRAYAPATVRS